MRGLVMIAVVFILVGVLAAVAATETHPLIGKWVWTWSGWYNDHYQTWETTFIIKEVDPDGTLTGEVAWVDPEQSRHRQPLRNARTFVEDGQTKVKIGRRVSYSLTLSKDGKTLHGKLSKPSWEGKALFKKQ